MERVIEFQGRKITVPADATDTEVAEIIDASAPPQAQPTAATPPSGRSWGQTAAGYTAAGAGGVRQGISNLLGLPIDAVNNAPRLLNLLPGEQNFGPMTKNPVGGSESIDNVLRGFGLIPEYKPRTAGERIVNRVGQEVGASAIPVGGALAAGSRLGVQGARELAQSGGSALSRYFGRAAETAATNPIGVAQREAAFATAAGTGAGVANEAAGSPQNGDNLWSDFFGSLAGVSLYGGGRAAISGATDAIRTAAGSDKIVSDVVREAVADRLMDNSTEMAGRRAAGDIEDTASLVTRLRTPSQAETLIPGYRGNVADRTGDIGLAAFADNTDRLNPGSAISRREGNIAAVDETVRAAAPQGDAGGFRSALEEDRAARLSQAQANVAGAEQSFNSARDAVRPVMPDSAARGSDIRASLQEAGDAVRKSASAKFNNFEQSGGVLPREPLEQAFQQRTDNLSLAERRNLAPADASIPSELQGDEIPLREVTGLRTSLSNTAGKASASGAKDEARVVGQYINEIDSYLDANIPPELRRQYEEARTAWFDYNERFNRSGTGIGDSLRTREGGGYQMADNTIPGRFTQPDYGNTDDFRALIKEAGSDPRARNALADEVLSQVNRSKLIDRPEALSKFMRDRGILLSEFPELSTKLERAGVAKIVLDGARASEQATVQRLGDPARNVPGSSAQARYLQFGDERAADAMQAVVANKDSRAAVKELLDAAGNTPEARENAKTAFWKLVEKRGRVDTAQDMGGTQWSPKRLRAFLSDPKSRAVAEELYSDNPKHLANIERIADALATTTSTKRLGGSPTAGALNAKYAPDLSAASLASRARSFNRGQMSGPILTIDVATTWLRRRAARLRSDAVERLTSQAVNDPDVAAALLEQYNPATWNAQRRKLLQVLGVRATQIINIVDESRDEDEDIRDAVGTEK